MLDLMKQLLGFEDDSKKVILEHHLNRAQKTIINYLNVDEMPIGYDDVIVDYAITLYRNPEADGLAQSSQGSRNKTFRNGLPQSIKDSLPLPKIRVV